MKIWDELFAQQTQIWSEPDDEISRIIEDLFRYKIKSNYELDRMGGRKTVYLSKKNFRNFVATNNNILNLQKSEFKIIDGHNLSGMIHSDITKQPFRDCIFDAVIALGVLLYNTRVNIQRCIVDVNRIMKKGGIFFSTFQSSDEDLSYDMYNRHNHIYGDRTSFLHKQRDTEREKTYHAFSENEVIHLLKDFRIIELKLRQYESHKQQNQKYKIWLVLAQKMQDRYSNYDVGSKQIEMKNPSSVSTINPIDDYFLNEYFIRNFVQLNILPIINLSNFEILNCKINPFKLSRKGGIAAIELNLQLGNKNNPQQKISKSIVGKWRKDGRGKEIFDLLQGLYYDKGFNRKRNDNISSSSSSNNDRDIYHDDHLKIQEPIAYFPNYNLMLTSKVNGVELEKILQNANGNVESSILETYMIQAAKWLAKLHSIQLTHGRRTFFIHDEEKKLSTWFEHLSWLYPDFDKKISHILHFILKEQKDLNPKCFVPIHGDFHTLNIFISEPDLTVIDFEQSCIFDPAKDLGYFTSYLTMKKKKYQLSFDTENLQKCFIDSYISEISAEPLKRIGIYKARSYIQHLHFRYWTLNKKLDEIDFEHWVNAAEQSLQVGV
jgi:thiamine kinase-like enzyme/SAM-dependent methyltransferase